MGTLSRRSVEKALAAECDAGLRTQLYALVAGAKEKLAGGVEDGGIAALDIGRGSGLVGFRSGDRLRAQGVDKRRDDALAESAEGVGGVEARGFGGGLQQGEQFALVERLRFGAVFRRG